MLDHFFEKKNFQLDRRKHRRVGDQRRVQSLPRGGSGNNTIKLILPTHATAVKLHIDFDAGF